MGACTFKTVARGNSAKEALRNAIQDARYENGHGGYTGTIAEKDSLVMISKPEGEDLYEFANRLIDEDDPRIKNKWGPAGCIKLDGDKYFFFGWASS